MTWILASLTYGRRLEWSSMTTETEQCVLDMLNSVGSSNGPTASWSELWGYFAGGDFVLSNGVTVSVFNDAGCWDYIDHITLQNGSRYEYPDCESRTDGLALPLSIAHWHPDKAKRAAWGVR